MFAELQDVTGIYRVGWERIFIFIRSRLGFTIPESALAVFFEGMSVLLHSGRSVSDVLQNGAAYGLDPELRDICRTLAPQIRNGASLVQSLRVYEQRLPRIVLCLLEVGEVSGGLADAAQRLSNTFQQTTGVERKFRLSVYDPRLFLPAFGLITLIQQIIGAVSSPQIDRSLLDTALSIVVHVAETVLELLAVFLIGRGLLRQLYHWHPLRLIVDTLKLAIPRLGSVSRSLSAARWARSFAALWSAGVPISTALEVSSASTLNAHYEHVLHLAARQTRGGQSLSQCLAHTQLLPSHLLSVIATCEISGRMDDGLLRLAEEMEKDALARAIEEMNKIVVAAYILLLFISVGGSQR